MTTSSETRLKNLIKFCQLIGMVKTSSPAPSPTVLGRTIDRNTNYCSDLLLGRRSFGDEIARHIEQKMGLPRWYLDDEANLGGTPKSKNQKVLGIRPFSKNDIDPTLRDFLEKTDLEKRFPKFSKSQRLRVISATIEALEAAKAPSAAQKKAAAEAAASAGHKKAKSSVSH
jgi:hypothetical protein